MAFKHMGASTEKHTWKYPHKARCIYSGNTGTVYSRYEKITESWQQDRLDSIYMAHQCTCKRCVEERKINERLKAKLEADGETELLKAMGW